MVKVLAPRGLVRTAADMQGLQTDEDDTDAQDRHEDEKMPGYAISAWLVCYGCCYAATQYATHLYVLLTAW